MDPLDAALFYLAMRKKGVLCGLFKTVKDIKMAEFFKNDFGQQKWQTAAIVVAVPSIADGASYTFALLVA